jgi:hypothetical protein
MINKTLLSPGPLKLALGLVLLTALTGCVGYVDGGGGAVIAAPGPDVVLFGGGFDRGRDVRAYSHRGAESRAVAHGGGRGGRR